MCVFTCAYLSLHGIFVQLQVLFGGPFLHQLGAQLIDLISAPAHSVCHDLHAASLFLQLQFCTFQLVLAEARREQMLQKFGHWFLHDSDEASGTDDSSGSYLRQIY